MVLIISYHLNVYEVSYIDNPYTITPVGIYDYQNLIPRKENYRYHMLLSYIGKSYTEEGNKNYRNIVDLLTDVINRY